MILHNLHKLHNQMGTIRCTGGDFMPLTMAGKGSSFAVKKITGKDDTKRFLANLGFIEGVVVSVVTELGGNLIINVKGTRVALDKSLAGRIIV